MSQSCATVDEYHDLLAEYHDLLAEVERLRAIIGDQQILLDEHGMDNRHSYEEGGSGERAAVVAWLRADGFPGIADHIERGEHRRKGGE